jgi:hypothetical protein
MTNAFDVIGDVHGQFDKLVGLLSYMEYRETGGAWRHPFRSVIFVGDLIDRGPKQLATVDLVRRSSAKVRKSSFRKGFHSKTRKARYGMKCACGGGRRICLLTGRLRLGPQGRWR